MEKIIAALATHLPGWQINTSCRYFHSSDHPYQIEVNLSRKNADNEREFCRNVTTLADRPTTDDWLRLIEKLPAYYHRKEGLYYTLTYAPQDFVKAITQFNKDNHAALF